MHPYMSTCIQKGTDCIIYIVNRSQNARCFVHINVYKICGDLKHISQKYLVSLLPHENYTGTFQLPTDMI
jgi:hypothetical protein